MRALAYYEQISHEGLDGEYNKLALENLNQVIIRFPNSKYAKDSNQKIILVKSNIEQEDFAANTLVAKITEKYGGGGGGRPTMAQAGGIAIQDLDQVMAFSRKLLTP